MPDKSLPTKPDHDAEFVPPKGKGPSKSTGKRATARPRRAIKGKTVLKPSVKAAAKVAAKKAAARKAAGGQRKRPGQERPDQEPRRQPRSAGQYVRLRVRYDDGELSVVGSHLVDSALAQTSSFLGGHAYEVTDGERLLHAGSLPDLGVVRSFAYPDGTQEQHRHHSYELSSYEFDVRVPAEELTRRALPRIEIALFRVKDRVPSRTLSAAPLGMQFGRELREVGRVVGIPPAILPPALSKPGGRATKTGRPTRKTR